QPGKKVSMTMYCFIPRLRIPLASDGPEREDRWPRRTRRADPVAQREATAGGDVGLRAEAALARDQEERERHADRDQQAEDHVEPGQPDVEPARLHDREIAAARKKGPKPTVIGVLAGVASVSGQNRPVAKTNPRSQPSCGRKY